MWSLVGSRRHCFCVVLVTFQWRGPALVLQWLDAKLCSESTGTVPRLPCADFQRGVISYRNDEEVDMSHALVQLAMCYLLGLHRHVMMSSTEYVDVRTQAMHDAPLQLPGYTPYMCVWGRGGHGVHGSTES